MNKKRDRLQIIHDILEAIRQRNGSIKPTHILYKSNLSPQMLTEYLAELVDKGFVMESKRGTGKVYSLTPKGFLYLRKYQLVLDFTETFGLN
ncbi:winged helix-turn-helix transcriptional regulator [Candidatus Woesearchaeota archaeon]|nr:winged helix-turn-helix transcriptional regulator [Candidatus Woesearchaeota archaeon]